MSRTAKCPVSILLNLSFVMLGLLVGPQVLTAADSQQATLTVSVDKVISEISPLIYGQFEEHLGRAIYGGIYEENSSLADKNGFRKDVLEKVQSLHPPLMRYPGGTVTKIYHWKDGVGPQQGRPVRRNLIWGGEDSNHFGTDEFMAFAKLIDAAPFLTVNMSTAGSGPLTN